MPRLWRTYEKIVAEYVIIKLQFNFNIINKKRIPTFGNSFFLFYYAFFAFLVVSASTGSVCSTTSF